jgi:predicted permease
VNPESRGRFLRVVGRLRDGVEMEQAQAEMEAVARRTSAAAPQFNRDWSVNLVPLHHETTGEARPALLVLLGAVGLLLLIACANVANLLLARGAGRAGEMAVRMSLGAGRRRLVRQLLAESVALAALGGAAGLAVARATLLGVAAILPPEAAGTFHVALDWPVAAFAAAVAVATGLGAGAFPALQSTRPDLIARVRAGAGQVAGGARAAARFRTGLVGAQVALSTLLLVTAALFLRTLNNLSRADLGLPVDRTITFALSPDRSGYTATRAQALFERVGADLAAVPGVTGVAAAQVPILAGSNARNEVRVAGFRRGPETDAGASFNRVSAGFFRAVGVPLVAGREFTEADRLGAPRVAVVNEAFVRKFGLGRAAVGRRMGVGESPALDIEIVGVTRDAKYSEVRDAVPPAYFLPYRQDSTVGAITFYVRTSLDPAPLLRTAAAVVRRHDAALPLEQLMTMPDQVRETTFVERLVGTLTAAFAALATLLAAVGLYGVLAYTVAQRTRELGVRVALGATAMAVRRLVLGQVGRLVLAGGALGLVGALALGRVARGFLYGVAAHDPLAIAAAAVVLTLVALGASYVPARRAARVDPTRALRYE